MPENDRLLGEGDYSRRDSIPNAEDSSHPGASPAVLTCPEKPEPPAEAGEDNLFPD